MGDEIIFYNGFNLLVDIIVGTVVGLITYRYARQHFVAIGVSKAMKWIDVGILFKEACDECDDLKWSFDFSKCQCEGCSPIPDNVTPLFSTVEAD